jgi:hypothetical protein
MTKSRIVLLALVLFMPTVSMAQSAAANRSWNAFWVQFSSAVSKKSKVGVKALMASEKDFDSGGGETRDEWLQMIQEQHWWGRLQRSVKQGTNIDSYADGKLGRVTKDRHLVFDYIRGRWRFMGPMGD